MRLVNHSAKYCDENYKQFLSKHIQTHIDADKLILSLFIRLKISSSSPIAVKARVVASALNTSTEEKPVDTGKESSLVNYFSS